MPRVTVALVSDEVSIRSRLAKAFEGAPEDWDVRLYEQRPETEGCLVVSPTPLEGDIAFDLENPRAAVERVEEICRAQVSGRVYVVTGAGRGVGVTAVALHLAARLAQQHRTCFIDLDTRWRGPAAWLGFSDEDTKTWADVSDEPASLGLAAIPLSPGFRGLMAPEGQDGVPAGTILRATAEFDRVVVDAPDGCSASPSDWEPTARVLVSRATLPGARRITTYDDGRWLVAFNRCGGGGEATKRDLLRVAGIEQGIELPHTPALRDAEQEGRLLRWPWSRYSRRIALIAESLERA